MQNKNKLEEFLTSIYDDKMITVVGSAGSGKSWLTYSLCEFFILKNKPIVFIDIDSDGVVLDRLNKSENLRNRKYSFTHINLNDVDKIISFITQLKDVVIVIENLNSLPISKNIDDSLMSKSKMMASVSKKLREMSVDNNLNIITSNNTYKSVGVGMPQIMGGSSIAYTSDTIVSCNKDNGNIYLKVEKSRRGVFFENEPFCDMSILIKSLIRKEIRKEKIKKLSFRQTQKIYQ